MSDPIKDLENFNAEGLAVTPLSPSEVRRLGDRMRRRRNATAAVAGVAAIAIIATPIALFAGGNDNRGQGPEPAPQPTVTGQLTTIPDGFPLADGWPEPEGGRPGESTVDQPGSVEGPSRDVPPLELYVCGERVPAATESVDRLTAQLVQSYGRWREVQLFPDASAAQAYADSVRAAYTACPRHEHAPDATLHRVTDLDRGDEAFQVEVTYDLGTELANDVRVIDVVRVGNAVLVEDGSARGPDLAPVVDEHLEQLAPVIDAMSIFDDAGRSTDPETASTDTGEPGTFGADGLGPHRLGMSREQLEAVGGITFTGTADLSGTSCTLFTFDDYSRPEGLTDGYVSEANGLETIFALPGMTTPEGIGLGSTWAELKAAYPELDGTRGAMATVSLDDTTEYWFSFQQDDSSTVQRMVLSIKQQACWD